MLFDNNNNLAGVYTEFMTEYTPGYDTSLWNTTDSVLIIGTAFNGPVGKPVKIWSPEFAEYIFGHAYNSEKRQEATLVVGIQDAWNRGVRGIYGCRVSGKEIYKDFQLRSDTKLKLRVSGMFPSNENKDLYFVFNNDAFNMGITIYKPSSRATIAEKNAGMVSDADEMMTEKVYLAENGITLESKLTDLLDKFNYSENNKNNNNVLVLSIVDAEGNDVTLSDGEAKSLKVGDMFPGLYTIGRDSNAELVSCNTDIPILFDNFPYENYSGKFWKKLIMNTDVSKDLPLYSNAGNLNEILGISSLEEYEFLEIPGEIDKYFLKNKIDYEEVDISDYELYERLGSGYAINARLEVVTKQMADGSIKTRTRVKEVVDDKNRVTELKNGIYSALKNLPCDYRVLTCANADTKIKGTLPKADDFKFAKKNQVKMFNDSISITAKVDENDLTEPKKYKIKFVVDEDMDSVKDISIDKIYSDKVSRSATIIDFADINDKTKKYTNGSIFLVKDVTIDDYAAPVNVLYIYTDNQFKSLHRFLTPDEIDGMKDTLISTDEGLFICSEEITSLSSTSMKMTVFTKVDSTTKDTILNSKDYFITALDNNTYQVSKLVEKTIGSDTMLVPEYLGYVEEVLSDEEDKIVISINNSYSDNTVIITSNSFDFLSIAEVVEELNNDKDFAELFDVQVIDVLKAQDCIADLIEDGDTGEADLIDKTISYNESKLISFRTDDNFARQLAQHVHQTTYEVGSTHGIIGVNLLRNTSSTSVANRVNELVEYNFIDRMVAKRGNGHIALDQNNMPIPLGRDISIVATQYQVTMDSDGYSTLSNGASGYAGMVACLPLTQSSTCQTIEIPDPSYELTNTELKDLTAAGYITIKNSYTKGWVVTDGITMAPVNSAYKRLSAARVANAIGQYIREACEPFIGKTNNLSNQNALNTALNSTLTTAKGTLINDYSFQLIFDKNLEKLGQIVIQYAVVPIYEIKEIYNQITVSGNN